MRHLVCLFLLVPAVLPLRAQSIPARGTDATFDVATWNIEWFGSDSNGPSDETRQFDNVQAVIEAAGIDLWAVQEIADPDAFEALLTALGAGYDGVLATLHSGQRVGFLYRTDAVHIRSIGHILESFSYEFASRPPFQIEADVTVADTTLIVTLITLHMKAFGDATSYDRRAEAAKRLKNHIDFSTLARDPVIVLGDFNDELTGSITAGRPSPYDNFVQDAADYQFLSMPLELENDYTYCGNNACTSGSNLDHILITDELFAAVEAGSADRYAELVDAISGYAGNTSDHLPVVERFNFTTGTAVGPVPALPPAPMLEGAYPNPFRARTTLSYTLRRAGPVRLEVYDILGRRVASLVDGPQTAGTHRVEFTASGLPPGLYLARLEAGGTSLARPLLLAR
jgi:endonuclease/exonuclease/phosphatase family metal-dependent hydrolase